MNYSSLKNAILMQFAVSNKAVPFIVGAPGGGKSSLCRDIARELQLIHKIPDDRVIEFNPSLREPSDILGLPQFDGEATKWLPPEEFYRIRKGTGPAVLIIEELSDATMDMQNPLCRVVLDRCAGSLPLSEDLYILASGNRTSDKSGAQRLGTKLGNRMRYLEFNESIKDWVDWATKNKINPFVINFLDYRQKLFSAFSPDSVTSPTPRSWVDLASIPMTLPDDQYYEMCKGCVGEGAATEYTAFVRLCDKLPKLADVMKHPDTFEMLKDADKLWAMSALMIDSITSRTADKAYKYVRRMPREYCVRTVKGWIERSDKFMDCDFFMDFCTEFGDVVTKA